MFGQIGSLNDSSTLLNEYAITLSKSLLQQRANLAERVSRDEAEKTSRLKSDFIANMSHELRTPLNAVMGFSELIANMQERQLSPEQIVEYASIINTSAEHLLTIINDILDISKIQSGRLKLDISPFDLPDLISSTGSLLEKKANDNGVALQYRIADGAGTINADKVKIRQVLINLVDNAIKYTNAPGTVSISCEPKDPEHINIWVIDTGIGMTNEELKLALIPFGQANSSRARLVEGTGLGLPIAEALLKLHGGEMNVASACNIGTEVKLTLPVNGPHTAIAA